MWEQYKKTFIISQLFIVGVCVAMWYYRHPPPVVLLAIFLTMELASFLGAWWGTRIKRRIEDDDETLPLKRRRD